MRTKLITALRSAATALQSGWFEYSWQKPESCNCGIIACALMHKSIAEMADIVLPMKHRTPDNISWTSMMSYHCPVTGIPENEVFRALFESGMTQQDVIELEWLSNPKVLEKLKSRDLPTIKERRSIDPTSTEVEGRIDYKDKNNVIQYMRAWADILAEEGRDDITPQPQSSLQEPISDPAELPV